MKKVSNITKQLVLLYLQGYIYVCITQRESESWNDISSQSPPHPCSAPRLELGWDMQMKAVCLPAPSEAAQLHAASCTHTPSLMQSADCLEGRASSAGLRHACMCVCGAETLDRSRSLLPHSLLCPALPIFLSPPPVHLCVVFLTLILSPPSSASLAFPLLCPLRSDFGLLWNLKV